MAKERAKIEEEVKHEPPLDDEELKDIRWQLFGRCPICGNYVKGWNAGPFHAERYKYWQDQGIDTVSGHRQDCTEKWRKA